jgi:tRNA modification GTPase
MAQAQTIFAAATPPGRSGVAVIRISGPSVQAVMATLCGRPLEPRQAVLCVLRHPASNEALDRALALYFKAPASFTGEDVLELHIHGGRAVMEGVLSALSIMPDLRPAEAGEFTRRAFVNGKLDLMEVEGLADLIDAETAQQRALALKHMGGEASNRLNRWRNTLIEARALMEAEIDFPDEGDVPPALKADALRLIEQLAQELREELRRSTFAERLREGFTVVLAGAPNAGKSTLLNALVRRDVAITSPTPGTTRDTLDVHLDVQGLPLTLMDTAGLRNSEDAIEREGIARARARMREADLVLVLESGEDAPLDAFLEELPEAIPLWRIRTQIDLLDSDEQQRLSQSYTHVLSAVSGQGLDALLSALADFFRDHAVEGAQAALTRVRHRTQVLDALRWMDGVLGEPDRPLEILAEELRYATDSLSKLVGHVSVDDLFDTLFSRFCIGK